MKQLYPTNAQRQESRDKSASQLVQALERLGVHYISCEGDSGVGKYLDELAAVDFFSIADHGGLIPCAARINNDQPDRCFSLRIARSPGSEIQELQKLQKLVGSRYLHPQMYFKFYFAGGELVEAAWINTDELIRQMQNAPKWFRPEFSKKDKSGSVSTFRSIGFDYLDEVAAKSFGRWKVE